MNKQTLFTLKALRKTYTNIFGGKSAEKPECDRDPESASRKIYELLIKDKPCMIARFGAFELSIVVNFSEVSESNNSIFKYIKGDTLL